MVRQKYIAFVRKNRTEEIIFHFISLLLLTINFEALKLLKRILFSFALLSATLLQAQNDNIERILRQIEQYNQDLKAFGRLKQARYYDSMKDRSLTGLHIESNYLFLGRPENYRDFPGNNFDLFNIKIGQEFRLPRYYRSIDERGKQLRNLMDAEEAELRQKVLLEAKTYCYEVIHINKQLRMNKIFLEEAEKLQTAYDTLYAIGSVSLLEQQRAYLFVLDIENEINQLNIDKSEKLHDLAILNGNQHIYLDDDLYEPNAFLLPLDLIQKQALDKDVSFLKHEQKVLLGEAEANYIQKQNLPVLDLGYSMQYEDQFGIHGIFAGFNLPLWSNKRQMKAAKLEVHYRQYLMSSQKKLLQREVFDLYNKISNIERYLGKYEKSLDTLKDYEKTLGIAVELGEMTIQEYIQNILDYKDMHFKYLDMEFEYHHLKATLMRWYL